MEEKISPESIPSEINISEEEIDKIRKRIESQKGKVEEEKGREEKIREEIKNHLQELQQTPSFAAPVKERDELKEIKIMPKSQQIGALVSLVFDKGLPKAVSIAKSLDNPAILDEFHDILIDKYYEELIKRKILKDSR
jgi:seryl-tRNA synthetase